jgi:hypothetical protein
MPGGKARPWLARGFWIAASGNVLLVLIPAASEWNHPSGEFSGLAVVTLLAFVLCLLVVMAIVAAIRQPAAYWVGLALVCVPVLWFVALSARDAAESLAAPSIEDQDAGRGYFKEPVDRDLADAIVAGDTAKVASLAPSAHLNAEGWAGMTFMRLALESGHANRDVLAILLRSGIDPDQQSSALYELINNEKDEALLRVVIASGVDLRTHMGRGQWFYLMRYDWPEGLALILDHGVDTEAKDAMGYTAIMRATQARSWPTVELLLAHNARTDQVGNDGRRLRDLLAEAAAGQQGDIPPRIAALRDSPPASPPDSPPASPPAAPTDRPPASPPLGPK